eukprot:1156583-Pelagomonas_calceolata.AAC.4
MCPKINLQLAWSNTYLHRVQHQSALVQIQLQCVLKPFFSLPEVTRTFIGYSTRVLLATPPEASPAGCVENQLLGKQASGVPWARLCSNRWTCRHRAAEGLYACVCVCVCVSSIAQTD